jgi:GNAT superfamily N-acetyltransferase
MGDLLPSLARPADFPEVIAFCGAWLSAPAPYFEARFAYDPTLRKDRILMIRDGGKLVSTTHVFEVKLMFDGVAVRCAGIGNVCTHEGWRGRGLARSLLHEAHRLAAEDRFPLTALFTNHWKFYEAVGYRIWPRSEIRFTGLRSPAKKAEGVRPADFARDLPTLVSVHDSWTPRIPAMAERLPEFWKHHTEWTSMHPAEDLRLALVSGNRSYARTLTYGGSVKVIEFGELLGSERETAALAAALASAAAMKYGATVRIPEVCRELAAALRPLAAKEEPAMDGEMMLRVSDRGALSAALPGALRAGDSPLPDHSHFWDTDGF